MVLNSKRFALACLAGFLLTLQCGAEEIYTIKFATLVPADTAWMKEVTRWADDVKQQSKGRLVFKMYPGGVMGDEPDVLRKLRSQQLQAAFFTGYGVGRIYSPARVLEMPFLFKNTDESDYVRQRIMPDIEKGFRENGFELLGWPEVGFLHFFSKEPIRSLAELKTRKVWLWQGDPLGEAFASAAGVVPVPLSIIDVYPQLAAKHGSIDTVYNAPFGAMAMQWHSKLRYATNVPMTNAIGALVVDTRFYNKLPPDLQQILKTSGEQTGVRITELSRRDNQRSIELLKQSGIEFMWNWNDAEWQELLQIRNNAASQLAASKYIPPEMFIRARVLLDEQHQQTGKKKQP
jgi:TRAP-type C4-dicarboxylate transport system substrate-binding protein